MVWEAHQLTNGVVTTRDKYREGELSSANGCRLKRADPIRLWRDTGSSTIATVPDGETILYVRYLAWEDIDDEMLAVTVDSTNTYLNLVTLTGTWTRSQTITGVATAAIAVNYGNQWFVGTKLGNYIIFQDDYTSSPTTSRIWSLSMQGGDYGSDPTSITDQPAGKFQNGDVLVYGVTEYDDINGVESSVLRFFTHTVGTDDTYPQINFNWTRINDRARQQRFYRQYVGFDDPTGSDTANADTALRIITGTGPAFDGHLVTGTNYVVGANTVNDVIGISSRGGGGVLYPYLLATNQIGSSQVPLFSPIKPFDIATPIRGSILTNVPDEDEQLLGYTFPVLPEYQPTLYRLALVSENKDLPIYLREINGVVVALTFESVFGLTNLRYIGEAAAQGGVKIDGSVGLASRQGATNAPLGNGDVVFFVSERGLEMTDGSVVRDACPDWSVESSGFDTSNCVLVLNSKEERLELYSSDVTWHFYYGDGHRKGSFLKAIGPHAGVAAVSATRHRDRTFVATSTTIIEQSIGSYTGTMEIESGRHYKGIEVNYAELSDVGLRHDADADGTIRMALESAVEDNPAFQGPWRPLPHSDLEQVSRTGEGCTGNWYTAHIEVMGHEWIATLWVDLKNSPGGN